MSEHLYRKPASAVTLPEAALIAGLIQAPRRSRQGRTTRARSNGAASCLAQMRDQAE
jgi:membrane peptidoglycan carboxypeptidase